MAERETAPVPARGRPVAPSQSEVARFYRDRHPKALTQEPNSRHGAPLALLLTISSDPDMKSVMVSEDREKGGTKIMLQHCTEMSKAGLRKVGQ